MRDFDQSPTVIDRLVRWAARKADIRAMILTSTRTNQYAKVDAFSDYDVILVVTDFQRYLENEDWLGDFGEVLVVYRDPVCSEYGSERFIRVCQYHDGTKVDYMVWPVGLLRQVVKEPELPAYLDVGYTVLLDKDNLTDQLGSPTHTAYVPALPTEGEYQTLVEEFFSLTVYVAKHICRGDLMPLKHCLDHVAKQDKLLRMLEWRMELDHNWSLKPGVYGKGLKEHLAPETWAELESTYVGAGSEENWEALFGTIALFRRIAVEVANRLGFSYPDGLDQRVVDYVRERRMT